MNSSRFIVVVAVVILFLAAVGVAQSQPVYCTPDKYDLLLLNQTETPETDTHQIAVEITNRSSESCTFEGFAIRFRPEDQNLSGVGGDSSSAAGEFLKNKQVLAPGATVHRLIAWSSTPVPVSGLPMNDCATHDSLSLVRDYPGNTKPTVEIRHVEMTVCELAFLSAYRMGRYESGEPVAKEWLDRFHRTQADFHPLLRPEKSEALALRPQDAFEYLAGTFESGYSGYFELFLHRVPADANCSFETLQKQEADGQTIIYVNNCETGNARLGGDEDIKPTRLVLRGFGLLPERTGEVEYGAVARVKEAGKPVLARAKTTVMVRDPKQPLLPKIDSEVAECSAAQLKATVAGELGKHWSEPRRYPPEGEQWQDGKVYEVTNTSSQTCRVGGVPNVKFLEPPEIKSGALRPPVCRNCPTQLYEPRESHWIDLKPNGSAHFMVVRRLFDPNYWFLCTVAGGIELQLPGSNDGVKLPFDAALCGQMYVSAWREGKYDADPLNVRFDRQREEREKKQRQEVAAANPVPQECGKDVTNDTRESVVFKRGEMMWGLSGGEGRVGAVPISLWFYNPTDKPQPLWTCESIDWFWILGIQVFDSEGHRVLSKAEVREREQREKIPNMLGCVMACSANMLFEIKPHTCSYKGTITSGNDAGRNLTSLYDLTPGKYYVMPYEMKHTGSCAPEENVVLDRTRALQVEVRE